MNSVDRQRVLDILNRVSLRGAGRWSDDLGLLAAALETAYLDIALLGANAERLDVERLARALCRQTHWNDEPPCATHRHVASAIAREYAAPTATEPES